MLARRIHLLQVTHDIAIGGLQQVVLNLCKFIDKSRFEVSVLCLRDLGDYLAEFQRLGIEVAMIPKVKGKTAYLSFLKVARILREKRIDVVHTHNTQPFVDGTIGAMLSGVRTVIHTDHARDFPDKRRYMFAEWAMSHFVAKVIGVSQHTCENLVRFERIPIRKIITIPNGVDDSKFISPIDKSQKMVSLGLNGEGPIIGLGVRLTEQKGITYLLQSMKEVVKHVPDVLLVIAGSGPLEQSLKKEAADLKISNNIHFIGPRTDMNEVLQLFDLYVLPSLWEGLPMVLLEAMAAGCPIVATDVGGTSTAVTNEFNGLLVKPADPNQLSSAILRLLRNRDERRAYADNAMKVFKANFTAQLMAKRYEQVYLDCLMCHGKSCR